MLGLGDFWTAGAMIGCILITAVCVVFGAMNWNVGGEDSK